MDDEKTNDDIAALIKELLNLQHVRYDSTPLKHYYDQLEKEINEDGHN